MPEIILLGRYNKSHNVVIISRLLLNIKVQYLLYVLYIDSVIVRTTDKKQYLLTVDVVDL